MSAANWQPTKKYRKDLWAVFDDGDKHFAGPLGYLDVKEAENLLNNVKGYKAMQLRKYSKYQPGKAAAMVPLKAGEQNGS